MKISAKIKTKITKCLNLKSLKSDLKLKLLLKLFHKARTIWLTETSTPLPNEHVTMTMSCEVLWGMNATMTS